MALYGTSHFQNLLMLWSKSVLVCVHLHYSMENPTDDYTFPAL